MLSQSPWTCHPFHLPQKTDTCTDRSLSQGRDVCNNEGNTPGTRPKSANEGPTGQSSDLFASTVRTGNPYRPSPGPISRRKNESEADGRMLRGAIAPLPVDPKWDPQDAPGMCPSAPPPRRRLYPQAFGLTRLAGPARRVVSDTCPHFFPSRK